MKVAVHTQIAGRYTLVDRLGTGAMGEVWRAQDTRFESRQVAVKLLREDDTLKEDALNRDRMVIQLEQQASRGSISAAFAVEAIASALAVGNIEALKARAATAFGAAEHIAPAAVTTLFDEVVNDPAFNDNAKLRAKMRRLFRDEANTVANLRHDNVVSIFDYGDHEGIPFLVMDYIEGRTLYQVLQARQELGLARRLSLMEDLCAGLGYAHRHKLVHRDIKPANLIIASSTGSLKILDFGVVRRMGSKSTIGMPIGTFCYMSPEQTRGEAALDHRSDIFAVGLVFYELMSGHKAFPPSKSIPDLVARIQRDPPRRISELIAISPAIEAIISTAIEKRPEDRYQDLAVMGRAIARIRAPLEAAEQSERTMIAARANQTVVPVPTVIPAPPPVILAKPEVGVTALLDSAERAFASGDDRAAVDFCKRILAQRPGFPAALSLLARAEARARVESLKVPPSPPTPSPIAAGPDADAGTRLLVDAPLGLPPVLSASPPRAASPPPVPAPSLPVETAQGAAARPPSSPRRRRVARPSLDDTGGPAPSPVVPTLEPPAPAAPPGVTPLAARVSDAKPRPTAVPADPAGEVLLVRPSGLAPPPAAVTARAAGGVGDRSLEGPPHAGEASTRRLNRESVQRALNQPTRPGYGAAASQTRPLALWWFSGFAVLLIAIVVFVLMRDKPTVPADESAPAPAALLSPPPSPEVPAVTGPPAVVTDQQEISQVVEAYAAALSARDVAEVAKVRDLSGPTRDGLQKAFLAVRSQRVAVVGAPRIAVDGARARVEVTMRYDVETSTGERAQTDVPATLGLNRIRNEWRIVRVAQ